MPIRHSSTFLDPDVRARALVRIGYFDNTKKKGRQVDYRRVLVWFVELPRKNLVAMSPEQAQELREEVRALQEEGIDGIQLIEDDASTAASLPNTQRLVAQQIARLKTTGRIEFDPFTLRASIHIPRFQPGPPVAYKFNVLFGGFVEPSQGKMLQYLFFVALKEAGDRLRLCERCHALFVQARRKQRYCTRLHQQVAAMRALRDRRRKQQAARKPKRQSTQKKGATHGPKRHR